MPSLGSLSNLSNFIAALAVSPVTRHPTMHRLCEGEGSQIGNTQFVWPLRLFFYAKFNCIIKIKVDYYTWLVGNFFKFLGEVILIFGIILCLILNNFLFSHGKKNRRSHTVKHLINDHQMRINCDTMWKIDYEKEVHSKLVHARPVLMVVHVGVRLRHPLVISIMCRDNWI